jgi:hypothetical protein
MFHCLFEQSGTFKNEFKKLGYQAEDYDILNDFGETDHIIDLFQEIEVAYNNLYRERERETIFDKINPDQDQVLAFFPCIRFSNQAYMMFQGTQSQLIKKPLVDKLEYDIKLHEELHELYVLINKLAIICLRKGIKLIIENPYSQEHYLTRYWAARASIIDTNRKIRGDYYTKPTQYFFINREPSQNFIFESIEIKPHKVIHLTNDKVERSMISPDYANRFIREYII